VSFSRVYKETVLDSSFENWKKLLNHYFRINEAHLLMLAKTEILPKSLVVEIAQALSELENEKIDEKLPDGVEDLVFLIERKLSQKIGIEKAGFLHTARSRNDIDATIFRMCVREKLLEIAAELIDLVEKAIKKGRTKRSNIPAHVYAWSTRPTFDLSTLFALSGLRFSGGSGRTDLGHTCCEPLSHGICRHNDDRFQNRQRDRE